VQALHVVRPRCSRGPLPNRSMLLPGRGFESAGATGRGSSATAGAAGAAGIRGRGNAASES
jgi:hypothetical protein